MCEADVSGWFVLELGVQQEWRAGVHVTAKIMYISLER
jgi:hypothetical protein